MIFRIKKEWWRWRINPKALIVFIQDRVFLFIYILLLCILPVMEPFPPAALSAGSSIQYDVSITGIRDRDLQTFIEEISDTIALKESPPASLSLLERRIQKDIPRIMAGLRSRGYYGARVDYDVDSGSIPVHVLLKINPGPLFLLDSINARIKGEAGSLKGKLLANEKIASLSGSPVNSKKIIETQEFIKEWFGDRGFPFVSLEPPKVVVDHAKQAASLTYIIKPGPKAFFGDIHIEGLESVDASFVRKQIPWNKGEVFNAARLSEARKNLSDTNLFVMIDVEKGEAIDEKGNVHVFIRVMEREHRTIKAGVSYKTDEGPGGKVSWENRNLLGEGERFNVSGILSDIAYSTEAAFDKPQFLRSDQTLKLNMRLAEDHPDAYTSRSLTSLINIERSLSNKNTVDAGIGFRRSRIRQFGREDHFNLISLPVGFDRDTKNDLLDPSAGGHLNIRITPFHDIYGEKLTFLKGQVGYSRYFRLVDNPSLVLAAKSSVGATEGAPTDEVPADIRFYAGGGGSIRGYAFQSAGPLKNGLPTGGNSLFTLSTELRTRISEKIGIVFFVDGGSVFRSTYPDFGGDLLWGAGAGFRYFTAIGPLRLDVGLPLNRREGIDDPFQIYVSLGQAF